ncbi:hypothetical protein GYMLUDRAFT_246594 [Collybiopsis luxurians FD-317 M1]|uniref:Uncharacterized protein n=1 Tax=Collybiopsis luxurians FD-317 M1 TaxID=944289 RepID=A0A0D0B3U7_9AGAR|nr:hypothetical protein GYMLUDRAFT_246594 [Collybiopsis luxurians FD-317 M1]
MTPQEQQTLTAIGTVIRNNIVASLIEVTGLGVSVLGMSIASYILITKSWTRSRIALLACLIITFTALTWNMFVNAAAPFIQDQVILVDIEPKKQGELEALAQKSNIKALPLNYMSSWDITISVLLSDFIVVWRAWVLFQQERRWQIALMILTIFNIGIQIADCIVDNIEIQVSISNSATTLDWISIMVSLVVNMFATGLIAWRAWNHHQITIEVAIHKRTRAQNILLLFIESGAIYCTIQVIYTLLTLLHIYGPVNSGGFLLAYNVMGGINGLASAWYPMAVVVLINMDSSPVNETFHLNQTFESSHREDNISTTIVRSHSGRNPSE